MNRKHMLPALWLAFFVGQAFFAAAQSDDDDYSRGRMFLNQGKFDSAASYFQKAAAADPDNLAIKEDQVYLEVLRRNFAMAITLGKPLVARADAGVKTYQVVCMAYREIAEYKEARRLYELAIAKFPDQGLLYAEIGNMFQEMNKNADAIKAWERGIEADPGHSSNYYHAAFYYADNREPLWALLYGENFVNLESFTERTTDIKMMMTDLYKKISTPGFLKAKNNPFAAAVIATFGKQPPIPLNIFSVEALTTLRAGFLRTWMETQQTRFPYRLFEYQDQLMKEGLFDAYNQWIFGTSLNAKVFASWMDANKEKMTAFQQYIGGRVYKIPKGQYYQTK